MVRRTIFIAFAFILLFGTGRPAMSVEEPAYKVERDEKPFQVRVYAPMIVATVRVSGTRSEAVSTGFRILADYIFGKNQKNGKIAMTAPVTQSPGEKIAMTAPVSQSKNEDGWEIRFIMPAGSTVETLPKPDDSRIQIMETAARRVAVVTFSGFWSDSNFRSHQKDLTGFIERKGLSPVSAAVYAYYNPPWTPWFLRRNEVQIEIAQ
jgi:hypothetical protein